MTSKRYVGQRTLEFLVSGTKTKITKKVQIRFSVRFSPLKENWFDFSLLPFFPYIYLRFSFSSSREIAAFESWTRGEISFSTCARTKNSMAINLASWKTYYAFPYVNTVATVQQNSSECFSFPSVKYKAVSWNVCNLLGKVDF